MKILVLVFAAILLIPSKTIAKETELNCLSKTIYYEALNQSKLGKFAVGLVIINRTADKRWPKTVCKVVNQYGYLNNKKVCQFSIWCAKAIRSIDFNSTEWTDSLYISKLLLDSKDTFIDMMSGITHYHADYVKPNWRKELVFISKIENHLFYREEDEQEK